MKKDPFWVRQARGRQAAQPSPTVPPEIKPDTGIKPNKGQKGGSCNRRACQKPGATWFNRGNYKFYCEECAMLINRNDPDQFGGRMCVDLDAEAAEIAAAHPTETGRHDLYAEAMRLVGERHAKGDLVDLVNWLLRREGRLRAALERIARSTKVAHGTDDYPMDRMDTIRIAREALQNEETPTGRGPLVPDTQA